MRFEGLFRFLFIQYCVVAGILLLIAPWSMLWQRFLLELPPGTLRFALALPALQAGVSAFGLVHLVWAFHDLESLLLLKKDHDRGAP